MSTLFEGKTVEEALDKAAAALGVERASLQHEVVGEKTDDFWGLGDKIVVVRAWVPGATPAAPAAAPVAPPAPARVPEAPQGAPRPAAEGDRDADVPAFFRDTPAPQSRPDAPAIPPAPAPELRAAPESAAVAREPATAPAAAGELTQEAESLLGRIFASMGFDCRAEARLDADVLQVVIRGDDNSYLLEERGRGLSALELVLNHALRHRTDQDRLRIRVDAEDFRSQREDELRDMAFQLAHEAKETGREQTTMPLNSYERRIVHLALADDPGVTTRSQGQGFSKAVSVIPTRGAGQRR